MSTSKDEHQVLKDLSVRGFVALREYYDQMCSAIDGGFWTKDHDQIRLGILRYADAVNAPWMKTREGLQNYFYKASLRPTRFYLSEAQKRTLKNAGRGSMTRGLENLINMFEEAMKNANSSEAHGD